MCGGVAVVVVAQTKSSGKQLGLSGPLARLSRAAERHLDAAGTTITDIAGAADEKKLRELVARYKAAPASARTSVLKEIAKYSAFAVKYGSFGEPVGLNEAELHLSRGTEPPGGATAAAHAVTEELASIMGAGFQTLVGTATGAVGTVSGPLSVAQYLHNDATSLERAGFPSQAARLTRALQGLPPAPTSARLAYARQLEDVVTTANSAALSAVAALRSEHPAGSRFGTRVGDEGVKLELTPPVTYASFSAAISLRPVLKDMTVNLDVLFVGGNHVAELNHQLKTLGKTVANAVAGLTASTTTTTTASGPGAPAAPCTPCATAVAAHYTAPEQVTNCGSGAGATNIVAHTVNCAVAVSALETYEGAPCGHHEGGCGQSGVNAVNNGQSAVECNRKQREVSCVIVAGGLGGHPIGHVTAVATEPTEPRTPPPAQTAQCGTQNTEEFAAFAVSTHGMSCAEADAAVKEVKVEGRGYASPPGFTCSSKPSSRGVEETACTSEEPGEHSFSWFLREP